MSAELFAGLTAEFGARLGIEGLRPSASGIVELQFERVGLLQMETAEDDVLVTLARPWPAHAEGASGALLDACHWRQNHPWPIHPGLKGAEVMTVTARLPVRELGVPDLERLIGYLSAMLDKVEAA